MRYAIKVGEIHLRSDRPITDEERRQAVRELTRAPLERSFTEGVMFKTVIGTGDPVR